MAARTTTAQRVHRAALDVFGRKGYAGASIRDIAKAARLSSATLYHYAPSKQHLLIAVVLEAMEPLRGASREIHASGESPELRLQQLVNLHVRLHTGTSAVWEVVDEEWRRVDARARAPIVEVRDEIQTYWTSAVTEGLESGVFACKDPKTATFAILSMCSAVYKWYRPGGELSVDDIARHYEQLVFAMLQARVPTEASPAVTGSSLSP